MKGMIEIIPEAIAEATEIYYKPQDAKKVDMSVIDAVMGAGKTTAALQRINRDCLMCDSFDDYSPRYIYVTPFLPEVNRVLRDTRNFYQPKELGNGKLDSLHDLLCKRKNIVCTHALFLRAIKETMRLINYLKYILVLDEALEILHEYNSVVPVNKQVNDKTVKWLIKTNSLKVDDRFNVHWSGDDEEGFQFSEIVKFSENKTLRCVRNNLYVEYDPEIFRTFQQIYVLTYLFKGSMLDYFFKMHGFKYKMLSAKCISEDKYEFCEYDDYSTVKKDFAKLITIYDGPYNDFGKDNPFAYSINWLKKRTPKDIKKIKANMCNYKRSIKASSNDVMWTTSISGGIREKLMQKGFKNIKNLTAEEKNLPENELRKYRQFVPCNARATNDFSSRHTLMYMLNRYFNPNMEDYFSVRGYKLDEDQFALSELLQWIWRSAIRNGEPINLYIPSVRMRNLLQKWLGIGGCET